MADETSQPSSIEVRPKANQEIQQKEARVPVSVAAISAAKIIETAEAKQPPNPDETLKIIATIPTDVVTPQITNSEQTTDPYKRFKEDIHTLVDANAPSFRRDSIATRIMNNSNTLRAALADPEFRQEFIEYAHDSNGDHYVGILKRSIANMLRRDPEDPFAQQLVQEIRNFQKPTESTSLSDSSEVRYSSPIAKHEQVKRILAKTAPLDRHATQLLGYSLGEYIKHHDLTNHNIVGFETKLFDALKKGAPQVALLMKPKQGIAYSHVFSTKNNNFAEGDFILRSYGSKMLPENLNELLMITTEVPRLHETTLEQVRADAILLDRPDIFGQGFRDFIHNTKGPYLPVMLGLLVDYYGSSGDQKLAAENSIRQIAKKAGIDDQATQRLTQLQRFDVPVSGSQKVIDVVRRLAENTQSSDAIPSTSDEHLNTLLSDLQEDGNSELRAGVPSQAKLGAVMTYINQSLIDTMNRGEIGVEPNTVLALTWLNRKAAEVLHAVTYEEQGSAYKQQWFQDVMKFQELTGSSQVFDQEAFEAFTSEISKLPMDDAYRHIAIRVQENLSPLAKKYRQAGKETWIKALWSGNTAHELIGLTDLHEAKTNYGRKHRAESLLPNYLSGKGD